MEYSVGGNGDNVIEADNYKLNLYYNPSKRGEKDMRHPARGIGAIRGT